MLRHNTSDSTFKCNSDAATAYVLDQPTLAKFLKEHPSHSLEVIHNHLCSCVCWVCCVVCCSVCCNIGGRTHTCALPPSSSLLLPLPSFLLRSSTIWLTRCSASRNCSTPWPSGSTSRTSPMATPPCGPSPSAPPSKASTAPA